MDMIICMEWSAWIIQEGSTWFETGATFVQPPVQQGKSGGLMGRASAVSLQRAQYKRSFVSDRSTAGLMIIEIEMLVDSHWIVSRSFESVQHILKQQHSH